MKHCNYSSGQVGQSSKRAPIERTICGIMGKRHCSVSFGYNLSKSCIISQS
jgi:hypothetical protein